MNVFSVGTGGRSAASAHLAAAELARLAGRKCLVVSAKFEAAPESHEDPADSSNSLWNLRQGRFMNTHVFMGRRRGFKI